MFLWHPIIVHFAIALLSIAIISDLLYLISKKDIFWQTSTFLLSVGTLSAIGAVLSGHQAEDAVLKNPEVNDLISTHQTSGELTMWIFILLTSVRFTFIKLKLFEKPVKWIYYLIGIAGFIFLLRTGILGGEMVYIHGVGIEKAKTPATKPSFK